MTDDLPPSALARRLLRLLNATKVVPWEADARTWQFSYVGPQAETLLGYPVERWYEDAFWAKHIHPEDREFALTYCEESSRQLSDYEFEYRMLTADGDAVWLHDIVNVVAVGGEPRYLQGFMIDITDRKNAANVMLQRDLLRASEREQRRIGRDLHDGLGQELTGIALGLRALANALANEGSPSQESARRIAELAQKAVLGIGQVSRQLCWDFTDGMGLRHALRALAADVDRYPGVRCRLESEDGDDDVLDREMATQLYRVAQESISNAIRHGKASEIVLRLTVERMRVRLEIVDDGAGLPAGSAFVEGLGIRSMNERVRVLNGSLEIGPRESGHGTTVTCSCLRGMPRTVSLAQQPAG